MLKKIVRKYEALTILTIIIIMLVSLANILEVLDLINWHWISSFVFITTTGAYWMAIFLGEILEKLIRRNNDE